MLDSVKFLELFGFLELFWEFGFLLSTMKVTSEIEMEVRPRKWRLGRKNRGYARKNGGDAGK